MVMSIYYIVVEMTLSLEKHSENKYEIFYNGVPSGQYIVIKESIFGEQDGGEWVPDEKRGGFKRVNPIIRFSANLYTPARWRGCMDQWDLIAVTWTREPSPNDYAWDFYKADMKSNKFLGMTRSISKVRTAAKKWMREKMKGDIIQ